MARPQSRPIVRHPLAPPDPEPATPTPAALNEPPAVAAPTGRSPAKRSGKQLGLRIPEDLYSRLLEVSERTGIPQSTLVRRGVDLELRRHEH